MASEYLSPRFGNIPDELKQLPQWVAWKAVPNPDKGKPGKIPINVKNGRGASTTNSETWATFQEVESFYREWAGREHTHTAKEGDKIGPVTGVGFVFSRDDPYVGVDLDKCRNGNGFEPWAEEIVTKLNSYTETSPSGTGVHTILRGRLPGHGRKNGRIEAYDQSRFFTVSGHVHQNGIIRDAQEEMEALYHSISPQKVTPPKITKPASSMPVLLDDQNILEKAFIAANGDRVRRLYEGDWSEYPSQSEADMALCLVLSFWTNRNVGQIDRIFRSSRLIRDKWDRSVGQGETYGQRTVRKTIELTSETYQPVGNVGSVGSVGNPPSVSALATPKVSLPR